MRRYTREEFAQVFDNMLGTLLPGAPPQAVREQVTAPRYEIGSRLALPAPDGRVFHYCKADAAHPDPKYGVANGDPLHFQPTAVAAVAGARTITIHMDVSETEWLADRFRGGSITIHTAPIQHVLAIIGNDEDDGTDCVLYLGEPLLADVPAETFCEVHENQYNGTTVMSGAGDQSVVAVPLMPVLINNYYWGQTWGPCLCVASHGGGIGAVVNEKSVYFQDDGSTGCGTDLLPTSGSQYAGFIIPRTWRDGAIADSLHFMLQLDP